MKHEKIPPAAADEAETAFFSVGPLSLPSPPRRRTKTLPRGTQARLLAAGRRAADRGLALNHFLTINTEQLVKAGCAGLWLGRHPADAFMAFHELLRHWHVRRGRDHAAVWVRENAPTPGEHLHIAFHSSRTEANEIALVAQIARWTGEAATPYCPGARRVSAGVGKRWDLQRKDFGDLAVPHLMAYFGKDEPDIVIKRGVRRENFGKPVRTGRKAFSALHAGQIEGTPRFDLRFGVTQNLR